MAQKGDIKKLEFWANMSSVSGLGVWVDYFANVCWLAKFQNFVSDDGYFKLYD